MLDKTYSPAEIEPRLYDGWEREGAFACNPDSAAQPFTIMIPPPNVTGSLHMGHALTFTVQDVLVRWRRMQGRDTLWQPGTDHAGIATQMVVERLLAERGNQDRRALGRGAFIERIWQWKAESGGTIARQLRRLGASLDWPRERFTMDPGLSAAVRKVFVTLYREGLIYRDRRLVNWDPKLLTAISDLEVETKRSAAASGTSAIPLLHLSRLRERACPRPDRGSYRCAIRVRVRAVASSPSPPPAQRPCSATPPSPCIPRIRGIAT